MTTGISWYLKVDIHYGFLLQQKTMEMAMVTARTRIARHGQIICIWLQLDASILSFLPRRMLFMTVNQQL